MRNGGGHGTLKSPGPALKSGPELNGEISVAGQMVNSEKPERGCKRWRAVYSIAMGVKSNAGALLFVRRLCGGC